MMRSLLRLIPRRFNARTNWRNRFGAHPDGWAAVSDRALTDEQYLQAASEKFDFLQRALERHGPPGEPGTLLDAGCGYGNFAEAFRRHGYAVIGVDYIEAAVERARRRFSSCAFEVADISRLEMGRNFDVIVTVDTLINVVDDQEWSNILRSLSGHLAPGGALAILERLRGVDETVHTARHVTFRTADDYRQQAACCGLQLVHHEHFHVPTQLLHEDILIFTPA